MVGGSVHVRVPAKINLGLACGKRGDDGYHPLATLFYAVSLYDDVHAERTDDGRITLTMTGEGAEELPVDDHNLAYRAAAALKAALGPLCPWGVDLTIRKGIPIAGGMAGGSADAAGALLACSVAWDVDIDPDGLRAVAAELGSDVPFALLGGTAIGVGRGDRLTPALSRGSYHWVLALAEEGLSTPAVYRKFDELGLGAVHPEVPAELLHALAANDPVRLGKALHNDLQPAAVALRPHLQRVLNTGLELGALGAVVSGSGPTCAFLAASEATAVDLSVQLSAQGVCRTVRRVQGPMPGARLLN